ncbi:MAG TPA: transglutaminase-like domain-containing protein [Pyrinomonadaceae bacterium]|nr:transglutaminase-like domain-containing protein [Pyrinomonadaceae bacterium]
MSAGSIFDSETTGNSPSIYKLIIGAIAVAVFAAVGFALYWYTKPIPQSSDLVLAQEIRDTTVLMLAQPTFSGEDFRQQILGKGRLVKFVRSLKDAYFVFPTGEDDEFKGFTAKYFVDPSKIDFAKEEGGEVKLGGYSFPISDGLRFFRTQLDNIKIDPDQNLTFPLKDVTYNVSLNELRSLENSSELYGGRLIARTPSRRDGPQFVFANHGIMVAKPGEPSLKRLTDELLKDVPNDRSSRIQRLVDFVSNDIEYSFAEALSGGETLKRPSETLMTRNGDCSNKTILLASLLEQIGEKYLLIYCPGHITVIIPQGDFPDENQLDFTWDNQNWLIAETTLAGFQIGKTKVADSLRLTHINYVQDPKNADVIFDANSYEVLKFF